MTAPTAEGFVATLHDLRAPEELPVIRRRLAPGDEAIGMRMRDVFAAARAARAMPLEEVDRLFASPLYEVRLGALCLLDLRARDRRTGDAGKQRLCELYLGHHDRITTWDMVDRAAPGVVGGALLARPVTPLHELAAAGDPLRRRTAVTAPLAFVRWGDDQHLAEVFPLAARLAADPDPLGHRAVGILLEHAGGRAPRAVTAFLDEHAGRMPRAAVRTASAELPPGDRARFVGGAARGGPVRR